MQVGFVGAIILKYITFKPNFKLYYILIKWNISTSAFKKLDFIIKFLWELEGLWRIITPSAINGKTKFCG